jgi:hypothetical protein
LGRKERIQIGPEKGFKTWSKNSLILFREREDSSTKISDDLWNLEQLEAAYKDELLEDSQKLEDKSETSPGYILLQIHPGW